MHTVGRVALYCASHRCIKRVIAWLIIICILMNIIGTNAYADEGPDVSNAVDMLDFSAIDSLLEENSFTSDITTKEMIQRVIESGYNIDVIIDSINIGNWVNELLGHGGKLLVTILFLLIACATIKNIGSKEDYYNIVDSIAVIFCIILSASAIKDCAKAALLLYDEVGRFASVMIPILSTMLTMMGGIGSAGLNQAMLIILNEVMLSLISSAVMPAIISVAVMSMIAPLADREWLSSVSDTLSKVLKWGMGLIVTISTTFFALRGLSVAATDGVMLRTAEYAIDDLIPVVGGAISDITGVMIGGLIMVKNAFGTVAIVLIAIRCAMPIMIILSYMLVYKLAGAGAMLLENKKIAKLCDGVGNTILIYLVACCCVMVMVMVIIISGVGAANRIVAIM